ncbi:hypothetical protein F5B20DRAFT_562764 [Whalleya microplaca]|nr:hypothetical protein F5B20DRAFT_562764 [Whalleya microplaca]
MDTPTRLEARYVYQDKLDTLLQQLFGSNYSVQNQRGIIEIKASRELSEEEIKSVTWRR